MKKLLILYLLIPLFIFSTEYNDHSIERRMAVDVGSGSTKFAIADIDLNTNQIVQMVFQDSIPVPYQKHLTEDGFFDEAIRSSGLEAFHQIKQIKDSFQVDKIKVIATEAFRNAKNSPEFIEQVSDTTGLNIEVIPQKDEGILAFYSASASTPDLNPEELVVWDIGTGSLQLMTLDQKGELTVFMQPTGSIPVRDYIIEVIQNKDLSFEDTPNPVQEEEASLADRFIRSIARKADPVIKQKIKNADRKVYGIGRLFYSGVGPLMPEENLINRPGLREFIAESLNKMDEEFENPDFANVDLSNCILVLGFMKALQIHEVELLDTTTAKGVLTYSSYWN